jgi:dUTP pyrophosphatase
MSLSFQYKKVDPNAFAPFKERSSDSGFDLTLIKKVKTVGKTEFYDTGIQICPPRGFYFDLVPRSSITKTGYSLKNSVGVLDNEYRGNILVALIKDDPDADDLKLPIRLVQIIPREIKHFEAIQVDSLDESSRGSLGFGSSG